MEKLPTSIPKSGASTGRTYTSSACDYCGFEMRFLIEAKGQNVECPSCGRVVSLGANSLQAALVLHRSGGERIRKTSRTAFGLVALITGWTFLVIGFIGLLALGLPLFAVGQAGAQAAALIFSLAASILGLALMIEGRRTTHWVCSTCGHRLTTEKEIVCHACHAELS